MCTVAMSEPETKLEYATCPKCGQRIVLNARRELVKHRERPKGEALYGAWCK